MRLFSPLLALVAAPALATEDAPARPDLMTFASGVLPISTEAGALRSGSEHALGVIDGNPVTMSMTPKPGGPDASVAFVYSMPAPTRFDRFAVPNVTETPSPYQTFFREVVVEGSATGPEGPWTELARAALDTHAEKGLFTELAMQGDPAEVSWVRLRLAGGVDVQKDKTFYEFSELIGQGTRQPAVMSEAFDGVWKGRGVNIELAQDGAVVTGCYDKVNELTGTVEGRILRALGEDAGGVPTQFILIATDEGGLRGLRSSNNTPFRPYDGEPSGAEPVCLAQEQVLPGCGSVLHGIGFDYDSHVLRGDARPLLASLAEGLAEVRGTIVIEGHSSSEGAEDYNRDLSQRRAGSVVAALVDMGLDPARISAAGKGEDEPLASNDDEAGRSMNRRVEVRCAG